MKLKHFICLFGLLMVPTAPSLALDVEIECPKDKPKREKISRKDVYKGVPFQDGEEATYELSWAGMKAGYGTLEVRKPMKYKGYWHRVFHVEASTGDWFSAIFVAKEKVEAISRPDFAISKFYLEQDEGKLFSKPLVQKKWLEFDQENCKVHERIQKLGEDEEKVTNDLHYGAIDALSVLYALRARKHVVGKTQRAPVYTSEKNWWLEAEAVAEETVEVPAGKFKAVKLKLTTFLGKELQQKGDVYAWIATDRPEAPLVQIQGEIKIGSVWIKLHKYKKS